MDEQVVSLLQEILSRLNILINRLDSSSDSMSKDSFITDCAERLYANTSFELEKSSEHEVAQKCLKRAKILSETLGLE